MPENNDHVPTPVMPNLEFRLDLNFSLDVNGADPDVVRDIVRAMRIIKAEVKSRGSPSGSQRKAVTSRVPQGGAPSGKPPAAPAATS